MLATWNVRSLLPRPSPRPSSPVTQSAALGVLGVALIAILASPAQALVITPIFEPSWSSAPAGATAVVNNVISEYESDFINPVTLNIQFGWGDINGSALPANAIGANNFPSFPMYSLAQTTALMLGAVPLQPGNLALAVGASHLPATYPNPGGADTFFVSDAEYLALTGTPQNADPVQAFTGYGTLKGTGFSWDFSGATPAAGHLDFTSTVEHEIAHAMGRADYAFASGKPGHAPPFLTPLDFYKYAPGTKKLDPKFSNTAFSIDGGVRELKLGTAGIFDKTSDSSDWKNKGTCGGSDSFDACLNTGVWATVGPVDMTEMEALGWNPSAPCTFECINDWAPHPSVRATSLTAVLKGDVVSKIDVAATQNNPLVNPFAAENKNFHGGAGTSSISVALDKSGNTEITYTGSNPILAGQNFEYGPAANGAPHFGYQGSGNVAVLSQFWSNSGADTALPGWTAACPTLTGPAVDFAVVYGEATAGGQTEGQWLECAVDAGPLPFEIVNPNAFDETLGNFGFYLSSVEIDLGELNFSDLLPPDLTESPFELVSSLDGIRLPGGGSVDVTFAPEPASLAVLSVGLFIFGCAVGAGRARPDRNIRERAHPAAGFSAAR